MPERLERLLGFLDRYGLATPHECQCYIPDRSELHEVLENLEKSGTVKLFHSAGNDIGLIQLTEMGSAVVKGFKKNAIAIT